MKKNNFQEITFNLKPKIRHDTMEGKPYLVAPMVMMTEGVHNGSNGPLYYPSDELGKLPVVWNHKPIVVYHPTKGSACSPDVLNARGVGVIMNAVFEDSKLKAEAWLEESRLKTVDERILNSLNEGKMMEVSTGLFTDNEEVEGDWNGEKYTAIARNHKPDHLAILPDMKGACSVEDGAGLLRLNAENGNIVLSVDDEEVKKYITDNKEIITQRISVFVNNVMGHEQTRRLLQGALSSKDKTGMMNGGWIEEVYDNFFIYENKGKFYKQKYSKDKDVVKLEGVAEEVVRHIVFKDIKGKDVVSNNKKNRKDFAMNKDKMVEQLISNAGTKWQESDKEYLTSLNEEVLEKMMPVENAMTPEEIAAKKKEEEDKKKKETANALTPEEIAAKKKKDEEDEEETKNTAQDYIAKAPKEIQDVLTNGLNSYNKEKAKLISVITANKKNAFTKEQLETKNLEELQAIAILAAPAKQVSYAGQGDVDDVTSNQEEPLATPVMNFKNDKK